MSQTDIVEDLLEIGAISLNVEEPFTWSSGLQAPIYCDNRLIMSHVAVRKKITAGLVDLIQEHFPQVEGIAGTATAGIPHAAFIAAELDLPMVYVRSKAKDHGKKNALEGELQAGSRVVMVEDLISTGGSVLAAAEEVADHGGEVLGCVAIFNYLLPQSRENFKGASYPLYTLTNYEELMSWAADKQAFAGHMDVLNAWYHDPKDWKQ